jgi:hypothetical protein
MENVRDMAVDRFSMGFLLGSLIFLGFVWFVCVGRGY